MNSDHDRIPPSESAGEALPCLACGNTATRTMDVAPRRAHRALCAAAALFALLLAALLSFARAAELPGDSVYHLDAALTDQDGRAFAFADAAGRPRVVSMFYSSCQFVCPMIVDTLKKTERALPEADRAKVDVLLVSLDPERDTTAALKKMAVQRRIDAANWRLAHTDKAAVRRIAAVLGVQYKQLDDGDFSHSSALVLLDAQGRIVARSEKLGDADPEFVAAIRRTLGGG